ncbi:hypothetical protein TSAR_007992 [Trichomalopsis sarcophagae]|uniref:Uncharacterized protein n=1 Tax=Trichomalopsis sarcophagae TaxID=543379 RepID=A0A232FP16_9HYME|nr:hypothetical protein TSAR_007992 [Trichomalopsis sarcophagae]
MLEPRTSPSQASCVVAGWTESRRGRTKKPQT